MTLSIDGYVLQDELGRGGMGTVHRARQVSTGRLVAVKILSRGDGDGHARFMREIRLMISIRHPNVIQFLDSGEGPGVAWFAMELIRGKTLQALQDELGPLPPSRLAAFLEQGLGALQCLHENRILHRDIKPLNFMETDDRRLVLMDLGLASSQQLTMLTRTGALLGTPRFLAPELIAGERASPASDIYAFGVTLYQLATGTPPFAGKNLSEMAAAILNDPLPSLTTKRPDLSAALAEAIDSMVVKDPATRPGLEKLLEVTEVAKARPAAPVRRSGGSTPRMASGPVATSAVPGAVPATAPAGAPGARVAVGAGLGLALVAALALALQPTGEPDTGARTPDGAGDAGAARATAVASAGPAERYDLAAAIRALDRAIDDLKPLVKRASMGRADTIDTSSAAERNHYQRGVERTFRLLNELCETLEQSDRADTRDPAWLDFEQLVARLLNLLDDLDAGREGSPLHMSLGRVRQELSTMTASDDFRGVFVRIAQTRFYALARSGPAAEMQRRTAYTEAFRVLEAMDHPWKSQVPGIHYRVDLLQRLLNQWERWGYIDADPATVKESSEERLRISLEMVDIIEKEFGVIEPDVARRQVDAEEAIEILVMGSRAASTRVAQEGLAPAARGRFCALLARVAKLTATIRARKPREKLARILEEGLRACEAR